jgi:hypothetical protein
MKFIIPTNFLLTVVTLATVLHAQPTPEISAVSGRDADPALHCCNFVGGACRVWCPK